LHDTRTLTTPSAIVRDLDPAIDASSCAASIAIRSAAGVGARRGCAAGGDPVAAALAAGLPSPEMLAAAGETDAIGVGRGVSAVAFRHYRARSPRSPRAHPSPAGCRSEATGGLADRAQQILASLISHQTRRDSHTTSPSRDYAGWRPTTAPERWDALSRQSGGLDLLVPGRARV
jgi:hypothetical protein